ncbi:MAG: DivIVA domain-containing protein [Thermaerobacterales bacterium]
MALTPLDIQNKEFRRSLRGYNETQVDEFLDEVVRAAEALMKDNAALKEQVESISGRLEQYRKLENTLHNALLVAQETAEEVKANARQEAELIKREARDEADEIRRGAQNQAREAEAQFQQVLDRTRVLRSQVRGMLVSHLDLLDNEEPLMRSAGTHDLNRHYAAAGGEAAAAAQEEPAET